MAKLHESNDRIASAPAVIARFGSRRLPANSQISKNGLAGKKCRSDEEVASETLGLFSKQKLNRSTRTGIGMLVRRWNDCVAPDGYHVDE